MTSEDADPPDPESVTSQIDKLKARSDRLTAQAKARYEAAQDERPSVRLVALLYERFDASSGFVLASYLAYRLFLLLAPLAVIVVAVAGFDVRKVEEGSEHLRLGAAITSTIAQAGADAQHSRVPLLISGLVAVALTSWGFLGALQYISAQAWRIPKRKFPHKSATFVRLIGSSILLVLVFYLSAVVRNAGVAAGLAASLATMLSVFVVYLALGWMLPRRSREWYWLVPGAMLGAVGNAGLQAFATFWLPERLASSSATYGAMGITLTVLSYLFIVAMLVVSALMLNAVTWEAYQESPPGLLRRISASVPLPTTTLGSGYVPDDDGVDVGVIG